ncbi:MAG TPA: MBOAT family O-acyltransferase [Saprospiraceae bacterium]|nr:MBOAT family O-acyltransferase [Saprospiraceae bacterium]
MIERLLAEIFLYHEGIPGSGMSEDLFFTKVYFWIFLLLVIGVSAILTETRRYLTPVLFGTLTAFFGAFASFFPVFTFHFLAWSFFAFWIIYYSITNRNQAARNVFLFLVSLFFYYKTSGLFFLILLFSTVWDFTLALCIHRTERQQLRKVFVVLSITMNLLLLAYFKYAYFFTESYNAVIMNLSEVLGISTPHTLEVRNLLALWMNASFNGHFNVGKILLPVGISFYTFQTISYTVDVYRKKLAPVRNILDFGFYVSFFPQLVSGPIVRAADFLPQLSKPYILSKYHFGLGVFWILNGLLKKAFLADFIANGFIDGVFIDPMRYTGFENLMAIFGYSLQVYADFSGYTDIAIGVALLLGYRLNTNFNSPYKAVNVGEFWKRWHISLSTWLRDYLYIPIGGNRRGTVASYILILILLFVAILLSGEYWLYASGFACVFVVLFVLLSRFSLRFQNWLHTNINLMVTMTYGGLWHGASWNFVIWGALNGIGLMVYKLWRRISPWEHGKLKIIRAWKIAITLCFISFTRIFFRSPDMEVARDMIHQLSAGPYIKVIPQVVEVFWFYYLVMIVGYVIHWLGEDVKVWYRHRFIRAHIALKAICCVAVVYVAYQSLQGAQPFIYFQF